MDILIWTFVAIVVALLALVTFNCEPMIDRERRGVAFWPTVAVGVFGLVSLIVAITVAAAVICGLVAIHPEMFSPDF